MAAQFENHCFPVSRTRPLISAAANSGAAGWGAVCVGGGRVIRSVF